MDYRQRRDLSPALLLAQQNLIRLREKHRGQGRSTSLESAFSKPIALKKQPRKDGGGQSLPDHLGRGSVPLTKTLKKAQGRWGGSSRKKLNGVLDQLASAAKKPPEKESERNNITSQPTRKEHVKLYPDLAIGMLGMKLVTPGRIWLLLRYADRSGRGWLPLSRVRELLTERESPLYVCGRRQLRKLLARGEGVFWTRDKTTLWLRSVAKVAAALEIDRLHGRPVGLPVSILLGKIGAVRAHFFASYHSGRLRKAGNRADAVREFVDPAPLSRATLQQLTHVKARSQRHYEVRAAVRRRTNYAISRQSRCEDIQNQAWQRGRAWFRYTDYRGSFGNKAQVYSAWQLPNSYWGPHEQQPIGRQKKINREIADLFMKGMTGNGNSSNDMAESQCDSPRRRFYRSGSAAAFRYNRGSEEDLYWPNHHGRPSSFACWHFLPGRG